MAKKPQEQQDKTDGLGELPPELQVDVNVQKTSFQSSELDKKSLVDTDGVYVVVTGHSVQHNGTLYIENQQIVLSESDANRLVDLRVVMSLSSVRAKLTQANLSGAVTINGG